MFATTTKINRIYENCRLRGSSPTEEAVSADGMEMGVHTFSLSRLTEHYMDIVSFVKGLPVGLRYSKNRGGMAWVYARHHRTAGTINLQAAEQVVAMSLALGVMKKVERRDIPCDVLYVVINDSGIRRREMTEPKSVRRCGLTRWQRNK